MKNLNKILPVAAFVAALGFASVASAQGYRATGDDGITASPKVRHLLNQQSAGTGMTNASEIALGSAGYRATGDDGITASPKSRQMFNEEHAQVSVQLQNPQGPLNPPMASTRSVGYQATGDDGITASPKARQFLNEHSAPVQVAPVK